MSADYQSVSRGRDEIFVFAMSVVQGEIATPLKIYIYITTEVTYFYVLVHLIDSFVSKNEIFFWGFRKFANQLLNKEKNPKSLTTTASFNTET